MDAIDREIQELRARFSAAKKAAEATVRTPDLRAEIELRERVRRGDDILSEHLQNCPQCLRAILTLDHHLACAEGKRDVHIYA